jgi:hypothetical protein
MFRGGSTLKTVVVPRDGHQSVADHLAEMRAWLNEQDIVARELKMLHVLKFRVVFRATFDSDADADKFADKFG